LSTDKWAALGYGVAPCPDNRVTLGAEFTISFDYKLVGVLSEDWVEVFRFSSVRHDCCEP